jgi:hypothetical protein
MQAQERLLRKQTLSLRGITVKPFRNDKPLTVSMVSVNTTPKDVLYKPCVNVKGGYLQKPLRRAMI